MGFKKTKHLTFREDVKRVNRFFEERLRYTDVRVTIQQVSSRTGVSTQNVMSILNQMVGRGLLLERTAALCFECGGIISMYDSYEETPSETVCTACGTEIVKNEDSVFAFYEARQP